MLRPLNSPEYYIFKWPRSSWPRRWTRDCISSGMLAGQPLVLPGCYMALGCEVLNTSGPTPRACSNAVWSNPSREIPERFRQPCEFTRPMRFRCLTRMAMASSLSMSSSKFWRMAAWRKCCLDRERGYRAPLLWGCQGSELGQFGLGAVCV